MNMKKAGDQDNVILMLYPKTDHNGALSMTVHSTLCERLRCWAMSPHGYQVDLRFIRSFAEAEAAVSEYADRSLHQVVLAGHGNPTALHWGGFGREARPESTVAYGSSETDSLLKNLKPKMKLDSFLLLDACEVAWEYDNDMLARIKSHAVRQRYQQNIDLKMPKNGSRPGLAYHNLFHYVASTMSGVSVTASKKTLYPHMFEKAGGECLRGDALGFTNGTKSNVRIWQCKDLQSLEELQEEARCLSTCGVSCNTYQKGYPRWLMSGLLTKQIQFKDTEGDEELQGLNNCPEGQDRKVCWVL
eukprot:TRINITY_DN24387_c0_g1_i1.p1 TRINITY_DN24387_c0_g1~~TRINITY_DN24387_c0_g1_i1.p1  ORF type:complete len:302 (+),score=48.02 TRINITY_DN24387_c0_g1_i1:404-1309(+)